MLAGSLLATEVGTALAQSNRFFRIVGPVPTEITGVTADGFITWANMPTNATFTVQTAGELVDESRWADYVHVPTNDGVTILRLFDPNPPVGMALIPAGSFHMGDSFGDGDYGEQPVHSVLVSAFYMDRTEVTKALWDDVYQWAIDHGYQFDNPGSGKAANHPIQTVDWYDCVKWCNARSEKEGRVPAYYTRAAQTTVYRTGQVDVQNDWVKWNKGYRLPTEAEWEYAARGGLSASRFPWGDTISHSKANYCSYWEGGKPHYTYDVTSKEGFHPTYATGDEPYTSPVGSFAPSGYGLYDLAGNVYQWCWDWYWDMYYKSSLSSDPRGPVSPLSGSYRVIRGGCWLSHASGCRVADRGYPEPHTGFHLIGFRSVLPPGQ